MSAKFRESASLLALIVTICAAGEARAQSAARTPGTDSAPQSGDIVVTAQRRSESVQKVPISISVLGGAGLDQSTLPNMTDILGTVSGVTSIASFQGGASQIIMRGVTANGPLGNQASTVAYYLDAVPFGFMRSAVTPNPDPYDLDRVEVLRGPQGTLYGANAMNGVIRILTKDPALDAFDFKARGMFSSTKLGGVNGGGDLAVNVPIVEGKLALRAVFGEQHWSGWINSLVGTNLNRQVSKNYRLKIAAQPIDDLSIVLSAWRSDDHFDASSNANADNQNLSSNPAPIDNSYNAFSGKIVYNASAFSVTSMTSYLDYKISSFLDTNPLIHVNADLDTQLRSKVFTQELSLTSRGSGPWRWTAGAFYRDDKDTFVSYLNAAPAVLVPQTLRNNFGDRSKSYAIYGEITRQLFEDHLELTAGLRYFHDNATTSNLSQIPGRPTLSLDPVGGDNHATTPRVVVTWHPDKDFTIYGSYSQGFRSGMPQDQLVYFTTIGVPSAVPDKLTNYELGVKGSLFGGRLRFETAVYYIDWQRPQQTIGYINAQGIIAPANVNGTSASGIGIDASVQARLAEGLTASANISYNNLHSDTVVFSGGFLLFNKGQRLAYSPEYTAGGSLDYAFDLGSGHRVKLSASASYISSLASNEATASGILWVNGDSMLNVRASATVDFSDHWSAKLFVDNLNNERGSPGTTRPSIPSFYLRVRPRTVGLQFDYHLR